MKVHAMMQIKSNLTMSDIPFPTPQAKSTPHPAMSSWFLSLTILLTWSGFLNFAALQTHAQQRNPLQKIGITVLDREHPDYRFERFLTATPDGSRTWRINVLIPRASAPAGGFPSFWMLDGNAALMEYDAALLTEIARQPIPHVLVFIGYDNDLRIDSPARTRDYTPLLLDPVDGEEPQLTGGADVFLDIIERQIRPRVKTLVNLNEKEQTLWAHSLGGMCVLHALFTRPGAFQTYIAGSPSMWWGNALLVTEAKRFVAHNSSKPARVIVHLGGAERVGDRGQRDLTNPRVVAHLERIKAAPPDAAMHLAEQLKPVPGLTVSYREFEGLGHGPMFRASLMGALQAVMGVADRSSTPRATPDE